MTRRLIPAALLLLAFAAPAHAAVSVSVTPSQTVTEPRDANTYTITYTADTDTTLTPFFQLPSHGQPCSKPEEQGEPYGNDPDSMFLVTSPGLLVAGRIVTWPDTYTVTPDAPLTLSLDVLMPPLGGCFYAGASATPSRGVTGLARGARVFNDQSAEFGTGGTATSESDDNPLVTVSWWMRNGTNQDVTHHPTSASARTLGGRRDGCLTSATSFASPRVAVALNCHPTSPTSRSATTQKASTSSGATITRSSSC